MSIIFFIIGLIIVERIVIAFFSHTWEKNLDVTIQFDSECVNEGSKGKITEILSNDKNMKLPIANLKFELDKSIQYTDKTNVSVSDRQYRNDGMSLKGHMAYKRQFEVIFTKRGIYHICNPVLTTKDYLGLYDFAKEFELESEIYVFPSYSRYTELVAPFSRAVGEAIKNKFLYEDPFEFKGIRDYTGTEPMKKINWSASAKTGDLKVNNYYDTSSRHATIFLDIANDQIWRQDDQLEECIRIARNYLEGFIRNHVPVEIVTNAMDILDKKRICFDKGNDAGFVDKCLRKMTRIDFDEPTERLYEYFIENSASEDELCILLSVDQSSSMVEAYEKYLGKMTGEWICPKTPSSERQIRSGKIHVTYVEVGR